MQISYGFFHDGFILSLLFSQSNQNGKAYQWTLREIMESLYDSSKVYKSVMNMS